MRENPTTASLLHTSPLHTSALHRRLLAGGLLAGFSVVAGAGAATAATPTTVDTGVRATTTVSAPVSAAALPVTWGRALGGDPLPRSGTRFVDVRL